MKDIKSMTLPELKEEIIAIGEKGFKAGQIYSWLHKHGAVSFDEMTNISKDFRAVLQKIMTFIPALLKKS